jgi:hypothetical protein
MQLAKMQQVYPMASVMPDTLLDLQPKRRTPHQTTECLAILLLYLFLLYAAVTKLITGDHNFIRPHHVLPPSLVQLATGNVLAASCLLPLMQLHHLLLQDIRCNVMPAEDMRQLSVLTSLTHVDMAYWAYAEDINTAAAGWAALPLRELDMLPEANGSLTSSTLRHMTSLTGITRLCLHGCGLGAVPPAELAAVFAHMTGLRDLTLRQVRCEGDHEDAAAAAAAAGNALSVLFRGLSSRMPLLQLTKLEIAQTCIGRAEAAALAGMVGLRQLTLQHCQLEDCSVSEIALKLQPSLAELSVPQNPGVTDACLPALAFALPGMRPAHLNGTGVTRQGLLRYILRCEYLPASDSGSESESEGDSGSSGSESSSEGVESESQGEGEDGIDAMA